MHRGTARSTVTSLLGGLLLWWGPALAEEPQNAPKPTENTWLAWSAPEECPGPDQIQKRLQEWLKAPLKPQHELKVVASATSHEGLWLISVDFSYGSDQGTRQVSLENCSEGADFVALTVALAIDPEFQREDEAEFDAASAASSLAVGGSANESSPPDKEGMNGGPAPTSGATTAEPAATDETSQVAPDEIESEFSVDPTTLAPNDRRDAERTRPSTTQTPVASKSEPPAAPPELSFLFGAGILGVSGSLPSFAPGPIITGGYRNGSLLVEVSGFYLPGATYSFDNWQGQGRMRQAGADVRACYHFKAHSLRGGPCGGLQAAAVSAREVSPVDTESANKGSALLLSALLGASGQYAFTGSLAGALGVFAQVPLVQPRFELSGGTLVFESSAGILLDLGLRTFF